MNPTIGRVVIYKTTEQQRKAMDEDPESNVQEELPAMVVAVWSDTCVNLKVITDGFADLWVTSSNIGENEGEWSWPFIDVVKS